MAELLYICTTDHHSAMERKVLLIHAATWKDLQRMTLSEKANPRVCILYDSMFITILKRENYRNREQISSCPGLGRAREEVGVAIKG